MARKSRDFGHMMGSQLDDSFCIVDDFIEHGDEFSDPLVGFGRPSAVALPLPTERLSSAGAAGPSVGTSPLPLTGEGQSTAKAPKMGTKALRFSGGYDGGVEVGFFGKWRREKYHRELITEIERAKESPDVAFDVLGRATTVSMTGARAGLYYAHVLKTEGIKVYIHDNFEIDAAHQPVRIQYEASALTGRNLYEVHARICSWLNELGFDISREVVSRVDLQVTCSAPCGQFFNLIRKGHSVRRGVSYNFYGGHGGDGSFSVGKATRLRIYDKLAELLSTRNELGLEMLRVECFDGELPAELTRIEYQLRREVLKGFGIDSLRDLRDCELSLVEYLTHSWFRILKCVKVRGSEREQAVHPLWAQVVGAFKSIFCGSDNPRELSAVGRHKISCETSHLVAQAAGCLASAVAMTSGAVGSDKEAFEKIMHLLAEAKLVTADTVNFRTARLLSEKGVEIS
ncbi:MAG: hypothetical protein ACRC46_13370 [Thermoguttaceae bacterium]